MTQTPQDSSRFYADLPIRDSFLEVAQARNFSPAPEDWHILLSDVVSSTKAINEGRYKDVNIVGAATLIAVLNAVEGFDIPFVFGGDGATLLVPAELLEVVKPVLVSTRHMARDAFALDLRVGVVPVTAVREAGLELNIAKVRLSERFNLAAFSGGGLGYADSLVKDPREGEPYRLEADEDRGAADFSGLECRWNPVPSKRGEIVSLLVAGMSDSSDVNAHIYRQVIEEIDAIFGDEHDFHPVSNDLLSLSFTQLGHMSEYLLKNFRSSPTLKKLKLASMQIGTRLGDFAMRHKINLPPVRWGRYRDDIVRNSDYRKFDEMIRMVISADAAQRSRLDAYLEKRYQNREVAYGTHVADSALLTCLIFEREGGHLHFVDGANGGYAQAAVGLKERIKSLQQGS